MAEESGTVQKTWTIVKFIEEDTVAMVPTVWLTNSENGWNCLWPPLPASKISVAVRSHQINTCWPSFKVSMFRNATYDDYQIARKAVLKAEDTSDISTDVEMPAKRRIIKRILSDSSEGEEDILIKIRSPPKFTGRSDKGNYKKVKLAKQNLGPSLQLEGHKQNAKLLEPGTSSEDKNQKLNANVNLTGSSNLNDSLEFERYDNEQENESASASKSYVEPRTVANYNLKDPKRSDCTCCPVHVHYTKEILRQIMFIKSRVNDIPIEPVLNHSAQQVEKSLFENPVINDEALSELNEALKNADFFEKAVKELFRLGGRNIYDFCVRCLKKLLTNELANQYSWLGRRNKKNFSEMEVSQLIIAAAEAGGKAKNRKEVEDAVSGWLRRANDRLKSKR